VARSKPAKLAPF